MAHRRTLTACGRASSWEFFLFSLDKLLSPKLTLKKLMIKRVFHGYKTKQTSTKQAPCLYQLRTKTPDKIMLISLNISGMFNQSSGISGYSARPPQPDGSSSQEQRGGLGAPWPQKVKQRGCLANLSETNTSKHFRD